MKSKAKSSFNNGHASSTHSFRFLCTLIYSLFYLSLINFCSFRFIQNEISFWTSSWHTVTNKLTLLKGTYMYITL